MSHPAVLGVNQVVYRELLGRGWDVTVLTPSRWRDEFSGRDLQPEALAGMERALEPVPILLPGRPQRHVYLTLCGRLLKRIKPDVAFLEAEPYSLPARQWGGSLHRLGVPFGVQCYENIDRPLPGPIRLLRSQVLRQAAFVAARSETAGALARSWGARGVVGLAPPPVPGWEHVPAPASRPFTIGYAGRLVASKGVEDLLAAVRLLEAPVELLLIGNGELRERLESQPIPGSRVRVIDNLSHAQMAEGYSLLDVVAVPSRTTATWKEQFGRVLIEAAWCGVPVVGSDSGEIPWVIGLTGGGLTFPEGDVAALAARLGELRSDPGLRARLGQAGRAAVERLFTVSAATDSLERLLLAALER